MCRYPSVFPEDVTSFNDGERAGYVIVFPSPSLCQVYTSGSPGAGATEDKRAAAVLRGQRLPGVSDGQSERWGLGQD